MLKKAAIIFLLSFAIFQLIISHSFAKEEKKIITVWAMGAEGDKISKIAKLFEESNPSVKVVTQSIPWGAAHEKLITAVVGGTTPDICQMGTTWIPEFADIGALTNLDPFVKDSTKINKQKFFEGAWSSGVAKDKLYGIPWYVDTRVMFYRKDLLREAGYENFPKNWEELKDACKKLTKDVNNDGKVEKFGISLSPRDAGTLFMFIWQNKGEILSSDFTKAEINNPATKAAVEYYVDFFKNNYTPIEASSGTDLFNSFKTGYFAMFISGPWMLEELKKQLPDMEDKWAVSVLPKKITSASFVGGADLVIFKKSREKDIAWKFIEFLSDPKIQVQWYAQTNDLPAVKEAWEDPLIKNNPKVAVFGSQLEDTVASPAITNWEQIQDAASEQLEKLAYNKISIDKFLELSTLDIDKILKPKEKPQGIIFKLLVFSTILFFVILCLGLYFKFGPKDPFYPRAIKNLGDLWNEILLNPAPIMFIFPSILLFSVFLFAPIFLSFMMSLTNWNLSCINNAGLISFVGLENYAKLLNDPLFWKSLGATLYFVLAGAPLSIFVSLLAAVALNSKLVKFRTFFRVGYFAPVVTTMVAVSIVWRWLYNQHFGLFNYFLSIVGVPGQNWLGDAKLAMPSLILLAVWKNFGYNMVIFLAGLQGIPQQLYEAAEIDGAGGSKAFWNITVPLLKPAIFFVTIMTTIGYFQFFEEPYIMTQGGPLNSTLSMVLFMYRQGFKYFNLGYASSMAYILFGIIATASLMQSRFSKQNFEY